ncbi:NUDIX hydrolase [Spirillospora sp. CA-253888]
MTHSGGDGAYDELKRKRPELFGNPEGAAVRILDEAPADGGPYGVCYRDPYVTVLRDPVEFPGGRSGGFVRILSSAGEGGAAVLPVHRGRVVLIRHFRHATRRWHWEIPRGFAAPGEDSRQTAERELREEIGAEARAWEPLGLLHADTGISQSGVGLFWADLETLGAPERAEGIDEILLLPPAELDAMLARGELTDSFTLAAILNARVRGLPPFGR